SHAIHTQFTRNTPPSHTQYTRNSHAIHAKREQRQRQHDQGLGLNSIPLTDTIQVHKSAT
ncbi:MAG: hypothetical protein WCO19_05470, partial [Candidatus Saccharibacteria bacterium]